jgi:hypothetical protein
MLDSICIACDHDAHCFALKVRLYSQEVRATTRYCAELFMAAIVGHTSSFEHRHMIFHVTVVPRQRGAIRPKVWHKLVTASICLTSSPTL